MKIPIGAPKRIFLQLGPEKPDEDTKFSEYVGVAWRAEQVHPHDIEYIRSDIAIESSWTRAVSGTKKP